MKSYFRMEIFHITFEISRLSWKRVRWKCEIFKFFLRKNVPEPRQTRCILSRGTNFWNFISENVAAIPKVLFWAEILQFSRPYNSYIFLARKKNGFPSNRYRSKCADKVKFFPCFFVSPIFDLCFLCRCASTHVNFGSQCFSPSATTNVSLENFALSRGWVRAKHIRNISSLDCSQHSAYTCE